MKEKRKSLHVDHDDDDDDDEHDEHRVDRVIHTPLTTDICARPASDPHRVVWSAARAKERTLDFLLIQRHPATRTCSLPPPSQAAMDIYSISFTHPRRSRHLHSPSSSLDAHDHRLPPHIQHLPENFPSALPLPAAQPSPLNQADSETVEKLAILARSLHNVQLSYLLSDGGRSWNFYISGAYQQVMLARGMLLKDSPVQVSPLACHLCQPLLLTPPLSTAPPSKCPVPTSSTLPPQNPL